ncbi:hypothetical protein [Streptomyces sp. NPDC094437]|uniref:hypothetical protein n=1 Tax=Streptomyces sp. NPDC094437 TaxID=3366060 RepID=UPI0038052835
MSREGGDHDPRRTHPGPDMGRLTDRAPGIAVTSRLTWTFSARITRGRRRPGPFASAGRLVSAALLRRALTTARPRPCPPATRRRHLRRR